jgi:hypothetical protein
MRPSRRTVPFVAVLLGLCGCGGNDAAIPPRQFATGPALAPARFACPAPGTAVALSNGGRISYTQAEGPTCVSATRGGPYRILYHVWSDDGAGGGRNAAEALGHLWPLEVGKRVRFAVPQPDGPSEAGWEESFEVAGTRTVTTAAGRFDTYVILHTEHGAGRAPATRVLYYAPAEHLIVRKEIGGRDGDSAETRFTPWEVTEITRAL